MAKFTAEMEQIFDSVFSGSSIDPKTGKMVVSDPAAFARADETLKTVIEKVAKEKWLMKENATDSLSHMAGLIKFEELNGNPSALKTAKTPAKPMQAPAGGVTESTKSGLGFAKVFESLNEFDETQFGDQSDVNTGDEVVDGNDSFDNAQIGAGDEGIVSGSDADMIPGGEENPGELGDDLDGQQGDLGMGQQGQQGDFGQQGDSALDFDLSDLSSFDALDDGQQAPVDGGDLGGDLPGDEELLTGHQNGNALA